MPNLPDPSWRALTLLLAALLVTACASPASPASPALPAPVATDLPEIGEVAPRQPH